MKVKTNYQKMCFAFSNGIKFFGSLRFNYAAIDADGSVYLFENEPYAIEGYTLMRWVSDCGACVPIAEVEFDEGEDWRDFLVKGTPID